MNDLIRRSDAIKAIAEHFAFEAEMETTYEYSWEDFADVAESILSRTETVGLERRGRWIEEHNPGLGRKLRDLIICSECGSAFTSEDLIRRSYCPNCGALMDGAMFIGLSDGGVLIKIPEAKE